MVATPPEPFGRTASPPAELHAPPGGPRRPPSHTSDVPQTTPSRVWYLRGKYQATGISEKVSDILLSASQPSTQKAYKYAWGRRSSWCH